MVPPAGGIAERTGRSNQDRPSGMERKTGFEPATATLARWSSTGLSYFRVGAKYRRKGPPVKASATLETWLRVDSLRGVCYRRKHAGPGPQIWRHIGGHGG